MPDSRSILVISLRFMGDVLLTTPLIRTLRAAYPRAAIDTLVPEHKLNLGLSWEIAPRARLSAALSALSKQNMDNDEPNTLGAQIPAYAVVDVKLARDFGWGRMSAAVNNLFDERYYTYAVRSQFVADRYAVYPLPGRSFSMAAELRMD